MLTNISEYISDQFSNPRGAMGRVSTFVMNRINQWQYKEIIRTIMPESKDKILEIGFGNGYLLGKLLKKKEGYFYGVEISEDMVKATTKKHAEHIRSGRLTLLKGNVKNLDFPKSTFKIVYTVNTIYFWEDIRKCLQEIHRVLENEGIFVNQMYSKAWLERIPYTRYGFEKYELATLEKIAKSCGFNIKSLTKSNNNSSFSIIFQKFN